MCLLLERVGEAWDIMVEEARTHAKHRLVVHGVIGKLERLARFADEIRATRKTRPLRAAIETQLDDVENELVVAVNDVPCIRAELVLDLVGERGPAKQRQTGLPPQHDGEKMIEAREMVHVRMRNEHM